MSSHTTGDLILASVRRNLSTSAPTIPGGWTLVKTQTGTTSWHGVYKKVAASGSETTGTWTSASSVEVNVYRGASDAVAANATGGTGTGTTITYPAITLQKTDSTSWVYRTAGATSATNITTNTPTGYTARGGVATPTGSAIRGCDSNAGLASSPSTGTQTVSGSGVWIAISVEILMTPPPSAAISTLADDFNTGSTPDTGRWLSIGSVTLASGQVSIPSGAGLASPASYDLTGDALAFQANTVTSGALAYVIGTHVCGWSFNSSSVAQPYVDSVVGTTRTHTSGTWYRVRESSGTMFWDYSSNGTSWTNHYSVANPMAVTNVTVEFDAGSGTTFFDNVNTVPAPLNTGAFFAMF
jgi:hypothetical protein